MQRNVGSLAVDSGDLHLGCVHFDQFYFSAGYAGNLMKGEIEVLHLEKFIKMIHCYLNHSSHDIDLFINIKIKYQSYPGLIDIWFVLHLSKIDVNK